jgi:hypothetical protein
MRHRQRGITFLGWIVLLMPIALVVYVVIQAVPAFLDYRNVATAFEQTRDEYSATESVTGAMLKSALEKRFDTGYISDPKIGDVAIRKTGEGWLVEVQYERVIPLVFNASLLLEFEKSVSIP